MTNRVPLAFFVVFFIVLLTVLVAGPLWQIEGIPVNTGDVQVHLHRSAAIGRAFEQGIYWPRWFPEVYNDLGAPVFHHYSPGLHWLVAAAHRIGIGLDDALKLVMTAAFALSGFGVYGWLRRAFSPVACLAGTSLYVLHPILLTRTVYYAGDYPQILALLLLPVCLWAFVSLHKKDSILYWLAAIISLAAFVVSHNLMALAGAAVLLGMWSLLSVGYRQPGGSLRCAGAALLAAMLTAGFWLPAVADLPHVQFENTQKRLAHFSEFFLRWWQLTGFQSPILDSRAGNPLMPINTFGLASWLAVISGLAVALFRPRRELRVWGMAGALFALGMLSMASPLSEHLWESWAGLTVFQYPSRFLLIAPLGASAAAAAATDAWGHKRSWLPALILVLASLLVVFPYLFPGHTPMFSEFRPVKALTPAETRSYEPRMNAWGMTSFNEFLVQGANMGVMRGEIAEPPATRLTWRSPHEAVADLSEDGGQMLLRLHFHPAWSAGKQAVLSRGTAGWTQVAGLHDPAQPLIVRWKGTVWQRWGERLSLTGLLATVAGLYFLVFRRRSGEEQVSAAPSPSTRSVAALVGCVLVVVVLRYTVDWSTRGPFLRHSPPGQLAFSVEGKGSNLGDAATDQLALLGWELLSGGTPGPGGTISVRLYWQAHDSIADDYHTFLHLYTPSLQRSWAVVNQGELRPPTRVWNPAKYYEETMRLFLPADLPPVPYTLVAGLVSSSGQRLSVPGSTDDLVYLREMEVAPLRPGLLQSVRPAAATPADTDDGLHLQGYDLFDEPGGHSLRLFWETGEGVASDWITYIHMTDPQGELVAQFDGAPLAGLLPTSQWKSNSLYIDRRKLEVPSNLAPGDYLLRIGLYSFESGERLPFQPEDGEQGHFESGQLLAPIRVHDGKSCYICSGDQ